MLHAPKVPYEIPPHRLYKLPVQGYVAIASVLFSIFLLDQTHGARIFFLVPLGVKVSQFNQNMDHYF